MKPRFAAVIVVMVGILFAIICIAQAGWPSLSSGYAITTDWHGTDVPLGQPVTAWAGTTNNTVHAVRFVWLDPDDNVAWDDTEPVLDPYTTPSVPVGAPTEIAQWSNSNPGIDVWYATNTHTPSDWTGTVIGTWTIKATFINTVEIPGQDSTAFRAISGHVVPEVPLGTIAVLLCMFGALALKKKWIL